MPQMDGRKVVMIATTLTLTAVGIAQIYLPFYADRDKIRGMSEEEDMPAEAKRQMELQRKMMLENQSDTNGGSMWKNMKK
mmetsp:Transcript_10565/g.16194  ORF Transcript_10565/g.16194 Transcript_10565/m.16194 type:complete len:80 (+) Transcript_10565:142-381(+)|eukprot:CAMPEP_0178902606 /NCGR_PEP_ID=MMETSP0786-20121207/4700_1 /TAXON_ID=186022 /ORGANISM="Thalassionema frauenfeldii, Strain CCMP 1798" /LENGTH=79 /DNA_ID=CAMNT_0020573895 /DNA_START=88 /DNA_END=327 /DNA_ORIENTATION=-